MAPASSVDPIPSSKYPTFQPVTTSAPEMPAAWTAVAMLHPFCPPLSTDPQPGNPFFQLCVANIACVPGKFLSAQIAGCDYGTWWYVITPQGTELSRDNGATWKVVDMGWSVPSDWYGAQASKAQCAGASPLNWMSPQSYDWWSVPVPLPNSPPAATWMWFKSGTNTPMRMMFGYGPPKPTMGDPTQLALFQMYSFTYIPEFTSYNSAELVTKPVKWAQPTFEGFAAGNPKGFKNFTFNPNFGFTAFMTPVNQQYNPLPTRVLYVWKPDAEYKVFSDRAQDTLMLYDFNPNQPPPPKTTDVALLTGPAPEGMTPPVNSAAGFMISTFADGTQTCIGGSKFPFPQEPPDWISIPAVQAKIQATITNNPVVAPGHTVTVYGLLFPPAAPNYPECTYLWTWYAPEPGSGGAVSRPVTFMQSQSGVGVGTSLALADYFYFERFKTPIDPANFTVPTSCATAKVTPELMQRVMWP